MKLQKFRARFGHVVTGIGFLGLAAIFIIVIVVTIDVVLRKISGSTFRIDGSNEITAFFMIILSSLWIPVVQFRKEHIWVPLIVNRLHYRFRCFWICVISVMETFIIFLFANGALGKTLDQYKTGMVSDVLKMPHWVFSVVVVVAFVEYFILKLIDTIQYFIDGVKNDPAVSQEQDLTGM